MREKYPHKRLSITLGKEVISTVESKYNGWFNYPTWDLMLHIDNEYGSYCYWRERAKEVQDPLRLEDELRDSYREYVDSLIDEHNIDGAVSDILTWAMEQINYREIADSLLET